ncbi:MAG: hypothetical protein WDW38_000545 [Sanguina aurantia]
MVCSYDGSGFAGFQYQTGKIRTVQGELEKAANRLFLGSSRMVGASRTDAGAHAYGQVVHFDIFGDRDSLETDALYFNSFLPQDVKVDSLRYAPQGFDAHFSSVGKTYLFKIGAGIADPTQAKHRWWVYERWCTQSRGKPNSFKDIALDIGAMREAAGLLVGEHDFTAFMDAKRASGMGGDKRKKVKMSEREQPVARAPSKNIRILSDIRIVEEENQFTSGQHIQLEITGNGFLYRMVRMLAAALVEVGHHRMTPGKLQQALQQGDRALLPEAAPPHGLYLRRVWFPEDEGFADRCVAVPHLWRKLAVSQGAKAAAGMRHVGAGDGSGGLQNGDGGGADGGVMEGGGVGHEIGDAGEGYVRVEDGVQ